MSVEVWNPNMTVCQSLMLEPTHATNGSFRYYQYGLSLLLIIILAPSWIPSKWRIRYFAVFLSLFCMNILCSAVLVPVLMMFFFVPNIVSKYIWFCSAIFCRIAGLNIEMRDHHFMRDKGKGIIIMNHMSALDSLVGCANAQNFGNWIVIVKKELKWYGPYGLALRITNAIFVDRSNSKAAMKQLSKAAKLIFSQSKTRARLVFYPEGTRNSSPDGKLLPFKLGAFRLAAENGVPIFPVVTSRYYFCQNFQKFERGSIVCKVLPPFYVKPDENLDDVAQRTRLLMQRELDELSEDVKRFPAGQSSGFSIGLFLAFAALIANYFLFRFPDDNINHGNFSGKFL